VYSTTKNVYGDDFLTAGLVGQLKWFKEATNRKLEAKHQMLGPQAGMKDTITLLGRTIPWTRDRIQYEVDAKHAIEALGLKDSKGVSTPTTRDEAGADEEHTAGVQQAVTRKQAAIANNLKQEVEKVLSKNLLEKGLATTYKSVAARLKLLGGGPARHPVCNKASCERNV
jgi:hypothetical protein